MPRNKALKKVCTTQTQCLYSLLLRRKLMSIVDKIIDHFGSKAELSRLLGSTPQALTRWTKHGVPANSAIEIERLSNGKFKAVDIPLYSAERHLNTCNQS